MKPEAVAPATSPTISLRGRVEFISLVREPASGAAYQLVAEVADITERFLAWKKAWGPGSRKTHLRMMGVILAGLLQDEAVRASKGKARKWPEHAEVGQRAFWPRIEALQQAGLVGSRLGVAFVENGIRTGRPTLIWAMPSLLSLATKHGLTRETFGTDWPLTERARTRRPNVTHEKLVECVEVPAKGSTLRTPCACPDDQLEQAAAARLWMERLNAYLATAEVSGCVPPVLRRRFFADLRLGGRLIAVGAEPYQNRRRDSRHLLRINGQRVAEVDLRAALLSIFLTIAGQPIPEDPYAHGPLGSLDREAVKTWINQTMNNGRPMKQWAGDTPDEIRRVPVRTISKAALAAYPMLFDPTAFLSDDVRHVIPFGREGWALGQWLTGFEVSVMVGALERLMEQGVVALPLHDAVLVPEGDAEAAKEALQASFTVLLGVAPRIKVKVPDQRPEIRLTEALSAASEKRLVEV